MTLISVTNALNNNSATSDITLVGQNFTDIVNGLTDGSKTINVAAVSLAGTTAVTAIASGSYTPTVGQKANIASNSVPHGYWLRIGTIVQVYVFLTLTATTTAEVDFDLTLPVASNLVNTSDMAGVVNGMYMNTPSVAAGAGIVTASTSTDTAYCEFVALTGSLITLGVSFSYVIQ